MVPGFQRKKEEFVPVAQNPERDISFPIFIGIEIETFKGRFLS